MRRHFAESLGPMFIVTSPITHNLEPQAGETTAMEWMGLSDGRASDLPLNFSQGSPRCFSPPRPASLGCLRGSVCDAAHIVSPAKEDLKSGSQRTYMKFD